MATTAPLFPDLPPPAVRRADELPRYVPRNPRMRAAMGWAQAMVEAKTREQKRLCYDNMMRCVRGRTL